MQTLLLDSHLLVLLVVGTTSRTYVAKHKRLRAYTEADFDLLCGLVRRYDQVVVTPHVLTEASNFLGYIGEPIKSEIFAVFRAIIQSTEERFVESESLSQYDEFISLGLTDAGLLDGGVNDATLLTSDLKLYLAAASKGHSTLNFHHVRERSGFL